MKIGFIGTGNMAGAIIAGITQKGYAKAEDIYCYSPTVKKLEQFTESMQVNMCTSNAQVVNEAEVLILAVKPNKFEQVLTEISAEIATKKPFMISLAAGITLHKLQEMIGSEQVSIIRAMPNVNVAIGEGMTGICGNHYVTREQIDFTIEMFESVGAAVEIDEKDFSAFTAIAGSSPAFTYLFIDALARGGVKNGISKEQATKIAAKAVLGSAKMVLESDENPWGLIDKVCSPGGMTIEGIMALEEEKFMATIMKAVDVAVEKDKKLI